MIWLNVLLGRSLWVSILRRKVNAKKDGHGIDAYIVVRRANVSRVIVAWCMVVEQVGKQIAENHWRGGHLPTMNELY
jgi:hypothetical protein